MRSARYVMTTVAIVAVLFGFGVLIGCGGGTGTPTYQAPRNLTGTYEASSRGVLLTWETSENNEETGYQVWRQGGGASNTYAKIADIAKGVTTYKDGNILVGSIYKYKVCTVYDSEQGPFSNEVEVDTSGGATAGYIWVADKDTAKIYRVGADSGTSDRQFGTPGTKPAGLAWDGSRLWHADFGKAKVYKLNPDTGAVETSFNSPGSGPWGLEWDGTNLWLSDFNTLKIYKLNTSGGVISSFAAPGTKPRDLAWDGANLWCADNGTNKIYKLNPSNGSVVSSFNTPGSGTTGLSYGGSNLWNADKDSKKIYKLNPANGAVVSSFNAPGTFPMGLAYQGD